MSTAANEARHEVEEIPSLDELAAAFLTLRNAGEAKRFLRDLCTRGELEALAHRWQIVRLLQEGIPYLEIAQRVQTSTATVTRVAQCLPTAPAATSWRSAARGRRL